MAYDRSNPFVVADASPSTRAQFYRRTYAHVAGAFLAWGVLLAVFFTTPIAENFAKFLFGFGQFGMMAVMIGLGILATVAQTMAFSRKSKSTQYTGFGLAVLAEAVLFIPLIYLVVMSSPEAKAGGGAALIETTKTVFAPALLTTGLLVGGITATVFMTKKDFSFMRTGLTIAMFAALGVILCAWIFGITLGFWFAAAMVALMSAAILYQTWQIKDQASPDQYVGAATSLFIAFVTLLWYVIMMFSGRRD